MEKDDSSSKYAYTVNNPAIISRQTFVSKFLFNNQI